MLTKALRMAVCLVLSGAVASGSTLTVKPDGTGSFTAIQAAIDNATNGDEIVVSPGTYYETITFAGKRLTVRSTNPADPNVVAATIINANLDNNSGTYEGPAVSFRAGETRQSILSGLSITGGTGRTESYLRWGGGILCDNSSPTLIHLRIYANSPHYGGGVCCRDSAPFIGYCTIAANTAGQAGGGIQCIRSAGAVIASNVIVNNQAMYSTGGGIDIYDCGSGARIVNNTLAGNEAGDSGGGICIEAASPDIENNIIIAGTHYGIYANGPIGGTIAFNDVAYNTPGDYGGTAVAGPRSLSLDPLFADSDGPDNHTTTWQDNDYHLTPNSPCLNVGSRAATVLSADTTTAGEGYYKSLIDVADATKYAVGDEIEYDNDSVLRSVTAIDLAANKLTIAPDLPVLSVAGKALQNYGWGDLDGDNRVMGVAVDMGADEWKGVQNLNQDRWYATIQAAIDNATVGDEIVIYPGTYTGDGNRDIDFKGKAITLRGTNPTDWNVVAATVIDCRGTLDTPHRGFYFHSGETPESIVSGLTITNGIAYRRYSEPSNAKFGGGIYCEVGSPTIMNCTIYGNEAVLGYGGGIYGSGGPIVNCRITHNTGGYMISGGGGGLSNCSGPITGCTISGNVAGDEGGGLLNCSGDIANCTIACNRADSDGWGGGLFGCNGTIRSCVIVGNHAGDGSGLYKCHGSIEGCRIIDNWSTYGGGGMGSCDGKVDRCIIAGNESAFDGAGVNRGSAKVNDCIIIGNQATNGEGGGISQCAGPIAGCIIVGNNLSSSMYTGSGVYNCRGPITNCLVAYNRGRRGVGFTCDNASLPITNCIVWGNTSTDDTRQIVGSNAVTYSCIQNWTGGGTGNITLDPGLVAGASGVWTVQGAYNSDTFQTTLTDAAAAWSLDQWARKFLNPDTTQFRQSLIVSNTATALTVWGDVAASVGTAYQIHDYHLTPVSPCINAGSNVAAVVFVDNTTATGTSTTIKVADALRYATGDDLEYDNDTVMRTVTAVDNATGTVTFDVPLGGNSTAGKAINNYGSGDLDGDDRVLFGLVDMGADEAAVWTGVHNTTSDTWYGTIQAAIDNATNGDVIVLRPGTYTGDGNRDIDFKGKAIMVQGGNPEDPNVVAATVINCQGTEAKPHRGFYFHNGETASSVVAGLTITGGYAAFYPSGGNARGGGIYCNPGGPTLRNCVITGNYTIDRGGGVAGSRGPILWCQIRGNRSAGSGGGMLDCDGEIFNCTITGNQTLAGPSFGGGLSGCDGFIHDCLIAGNSVSGQLSYGAGVSSCGGVIRNCVVVRNANKGAFSDDCYGGGFADCRGTIEKCVIADNSGSGQGGALGNPSGKVQDCLIVGNRASYSGGGIWRGSATISNCLIVGNWTDNAYTGYEGGGGISIAQGKIINCTVVGNASCCPGGGLKGVSGVITNCVVWGNSAPSNPQIYGSTVPSYTCIQDWSDGGLGNITQDPQFAAGAGGTWSVNGVYNSATYQSTLTAASATWISGQWEGKTVNPDATQFKQFVIVSNTATTLTVWGDASSVAQAGDVFQIHDYHLPVTSPCVNAGSNAGAVVFPDNTTAAGTTITIAVADALRYAIGDEIEYDNDTILRTVTALDNATGTVTFHTPLAGNSVAGKTINNYGRGDLDGDNRVIGGRVDMGADEAVGTGLWGTLVLNDFAGDKTLVPVTVTILSDPPEAHTVRPDALGRFSLVTVLTGTYDLIIKAPHSLARRLAQVTMGGNVPNVTLTNGDCDGNNAINAADLSVLIVAMDTDNPALDLDGDLQVTSTDVSIALAGMGLTGD